MGADATRFEVIEFKGKGDPYFGGSADDRPLGKSGQFLRGCYSGSDIAQFDSHEAAEKAASAAARRQGSILGFIPVEFSR